MEIQAKESWLNTQQTQNQRNQMSGKNSFGSVVAVGLMGGNKKKDKPVDDQLVTPRISDTEADLSF